VEEAVEPNTFQPLLYAIKAAGHANAQHKQRWYRAQAPFENPSDFQRALFSFDDEGGRVHVSNNKLWWS